MPEYLETAVDKFIFRVATDRLYGRDGIWLLAAGEGRVRLGVSDYFQQRAGDVAFVHFKPIGTTLAAGEELAELETVKANASLLRARRRNPAGSEPGAGTRLPRRSTKTLTARGGWRFYKSAPGAARPGGVCSIRDRTCR